MRLLLLNPNTTEAMTEQMFEVALATSGPDVEIIPATVTRGVPYIASRAEAQIAGAEVLDVLAREADGIDAAIIAAFGDPGVIAARELFDFPVIGVAEAAVMSAALLGERFGVVTFSPLMARWYTACVQQTGLANRFTGVRCPDTPPDNVGTVATALRSDLIALTELAAKQDCADVVILGGAPLAGLAAKLATDAPCLLVDPVAAAVVQATGLVRLAPSYANRSSLPAAKTSTGLGPALAAVLSEDRR
ncbi:MAG: aspartate/glutamate racemase family protein [Pseudomonadota bacterium]